jgi:anaerobic magnesium-protoporphyrin IX monomethyl ester cyclase
MRVAYIFPPPWDPTFPSYAMALFKASTEKAKHQFLGFDLNVDMHNAAEREDKPLWDGQYAVRWMLEKDSIIRKFSAFLDSYIDEIIRCRVDLYTIYASIYSKEYAFFIAEKIKEKDTEARILLGGPQCFPAYDGTKILENRYVDAICTGEGDLVWPIILDHVSVYGDLQLDIPGIAYKKDDGTIIDGGIPGLVKDLNLIPFADYSDVDFRKYGSKFQIGIMTSRGCINTCAFCSERPNFYRYRHRDAQSVFSEVVRHIEVIERAAGEYDRQERIRSLGRNLLTLRLRRIVRRIRNEGISFINFNDSLINGAPKELEAFCDVVIERGTKFRWCGMALIRKEMTEELLAKMKKAGCYYISWGLESGCQRVIDLMHKKFFSMEVAKEVIKRTYDAGILQGISLIVGFPGETEDMFGETLEFLKEYKTYFSSVGAQPMMIVPNSRVYDRYDEFGLDQDERSKLVNWQTIDGTNTHEVRLKRLEILKAVLDDKIITIDKW